MTMRMTLSITLIPIILMSAGCGRSLNFGCARSDTACVARRSAVHRGAALAQDSGWEGVDAEARCGGDTACIRAFYDAFALLPIPGQGACDLLHTVWREIGRLHWGVMTSHKSEEWRALFEHHRWYGLRAPCGGVVGCDERTNDGPIELDLSMDKPACDTWAARYPRNVRWMK